MRFHALDSWRGVAALLVVLVHLTANGAFYHLPFIRHGGLSVPFFFVLSGFVISHAYGQRLRNWADVSRFMLRRIGRLYPLHIAVLGALVVLEFTKLAMVHGGLPSGQVPFDGSNSIPALIANLFLLQAIVPFGDYTWNVPSWSISVEFYTYLIFCAVIVSSGRRATLAAIVVVLLSATLLLLIEARYPMLKQTQFRGLASCVCGFFTGQLIHRVFGMLPRPVAGVATMLELAAVLAIVALYWFSPFETVFAILVFAGVVMVFAFDGGAISQVLKMRPFAYLGKISYSIYMVHFFLLSLLGGVLRGFQAILHRHLYHNIEGTLTIDFGPHGAMDGLALLYVIAVIALAALTYRWIEVPGQAFFNHLVRALELTAPRFPAERSDER